MFPFLDLIFRNAWILPIVSLKPSSTNRRKDRLPSLVSWASLVAQTVKDLPAMWETWVQSLGWEDPLEEGMATPSSTLAWRIPMERGALRTTVMWSQRVGHDRATKYSMA